MAPAGVPGSSPWSLGHRLREWQSRGSQSQAPNSWPFSCDSSWPPLGMWEALDSRAEVRLLHPQPGPGESHPPRFRSRESAPASHRVDEMLLRPPARSQVQRRASIEHAGIHPGPAWRRNCTRPRPPGSPQPGAALSSHSRAPPGGRKMSAKAPFRGGMPLRRGPHAWALGPAALPDGLPHLHINVSLGFKGSSMRVGFLCRVAMWRQARPGDGVRMRGLHLPAQLSLSLWTLPYPSAPRDSRPIPAYSVPPDHKTVKTQTQKNPLKSLGERNSKFPPFQSCY